MNKHVRKRKKHQRQAAAKLYNKQKKKVFTDFCLALTNICLPTLVANKPVRIQPVTAYTKAEVDEMLKQNTAKRLSNTNKEG